MDMMSGTVRVLAKVVGGMVCLGISADAIAGHETRDALIGWLALTAAWMAVWAYL